jgi:hypothetical protein
MSGGAPAAGGSSGRSGAGGRAGAGAAGAAGVINIDAGSPPFDGGMDAGSDPNVVYRAIVVNPIDSGDEVMFTRADAITNTCIFFTIFVPAGAGMPVPITAATASFGADSCCPSDPNFALPCDTNSGCPTSSTFVGSISGNPEDGFDVDLQLDFTEPRMWLPPVVQFRTENLRYGTCD